MSASMRERIMIKSLILSDKQAEKYNDILTETKEEDYIGLSKSAYMQECMNKKLNSSSEFEFDSYSFKSKITLDKDSLVFFSVPYNLGWTAKVNGKNADVERVSNGFMAVKAYEGENTIEFSYRTSGLYEGFIISIIGLIGFIAYMLITRKSKNDTYPHTHYYGYNSSEKLSASLDYYEEINSKFGRK
jgi:uncharacterized membrane protein YfhO